MELKLFEKWMEINTSYAQSTVSKYVRGFRTTESEMLKRDVISKNLTQMNVSELDSAIEKILKDSEFRAKNKRGNNMYSCALKQYRCYVSHKSENVEIVMEDIKSINKASNLTATEKEVLSKARMGQGQFRDSLFAKYDSKCIITGISIPQVLIASHVKPWAVSTNEDRVSPENGLLLSATYDRLFDTGLISFRDNGEIILSSNLKEEDITRLHLQKKTKYPIKSTQELRLNLEYHRDTILV